MTQLSGKVLARAEYQDAAQALQFVTDLQTTTKKNVLPAFSCVSRNKGWDQHPGGTVLVRQTLYRSSRSGLTA